MLIHTGTRYTCLYLRQSASLCDPAANLADVSTSRLACTFTYTMVDVRIVNASKHDFVNMGSFGKTFFRKTRGTARHARAYVHGRRASLCVLAVISVAAALAAQAAAQDVDSPCSPNPCKNRGPCCRPHHAAPFFLIHACPMLTLRNFCSTRVYMW